MAVGTVVVLPLAALAATITVNTTADNTTAGDGQCTLREALANVNAAADTTSADCAAGTGAGDTITFDLAPPAKMTLTLGELVVGQNVSIVGPTTGSLRIDGAHATRVLHVAAGTTSVSDLTIEQGKADFLGGGIMNEGTLSLTNCTLKGNQLVERGSGGAIFNGGTMILTNCTLKRNRLVRDGAGGAIYNNGTATLTNCTLERNTGGNGGAISNGGTLTMTNCTLSGNRGGQGGGLHNAGTTTLTNCTLKGNRGRSGVGGGILNIGAVTLTNCTLDRNRAFAGKGSLGGGGIWHYSGGTATLTNTIVANSGRGGNCGGDPIASAGHNLSSDGSCFTGGGTDLLNTDPMLARLANYGGLTDTLALCSGAGLPSRSCTGASPAIDAGDDTVTGPPDNLTTDQRGLPRNAGLHVDIGAYEVQ
jgi:CSLREA domain-containing protein